MNNALPFAARVTAAFAAVTMTLILVSNVVSFAEPQFSVLMAKSERSQKKLDRAVSAVVLASNDAAHAGK